MDYLEINKANVVVAGVGGRMMRTSILSQWSGAALEQLTARIASLIMSVTKRSAYARDQFAPIGDGMRQGYGC